MIGFKNLNLDMIRSLMTSLYPTRSYPEFIFYFKILFAIVFYTFYIRT